MPDSLHLRGLSIKRHGVDLLAFDATILPGEVLTVMGPSGSGKSTLLSAVTGTLPVGFAMMGRVCIGDDDVTNFPTEKRRIGILFQDDLLFPHLSVGGNLAFGLHPSIRNRTARRTAVNDALKAVGLEGFADRDPATLSGGQKARVSLMRVLLSEPRVLLLDEAFSKLDAELRAHVRTLVFDTAKQKNLPVLQVTHDEADANAAGGPVRRLQTINP